MYKRPLPRLSPLASPLPIVPVKESLVTKLIKIQESVPVVKPRAYVPIWHPAETQPAPIIKPADRPFPVHVHAVYQKFCPHVPPLKALCDAMKLDGYPPEKIKQARDRHAKMNRTEDQRQAELDKVFGRYNAKATKTVKKVLKVVKKRNVGQGDVS